jgi:hypothetical protein
MWFYCAQGTHCANGMVGVINPPTTGGQNLNDYRSGALGVTARSLKPENVQGGVLGSPPAGSSVSSTPVPSDTAGTKETPGSWVAAFVAIVFAVFL